MVDTLIRPILDIFIFLARHLVFTFAVIFVLSWFWTSWSRHLATPNHFNNLFTSKKLSGLAVGLVGLFTAIGIWYMTTNGFAGEVEPIVSCLSWLVQNGQPLYTDFDAAERYSVLYGPSVFLTNGLFLRILGPSLGSVKLASIFSNVGSLVFLYAALARWRRDAMALGIVGLAVLYYWTQGFAVYLVRPDAMLLFSVGLGLYAAVRSRYWLALVTVAITAGFAINLKAHGLVYFLPVLVVLYERYGRREVLLTMLGIIGVVAFPFFLYPQVSLVNYVGWLTNAMSHGLETETISQTVNYAVFLLLPLLMMIAVATNRGEVWRTHRLALLTLVPVFGLTLLLACKPGAGPVHLLPLVPSTMFLLGRVYETVMVGYKRPRMRFGLHRAVFTATIISTLLAGTVNAYRAVRYVDYQIKRTPDLVQDVESIMRDYPTLTIAMACGGEDLNFRKTWLRPLLIFADNPLLIDPISVMDSSLAGKDLSAETYRAISEGRVAVWLVPRQQVPFAKENWYDPHNPLFTSKFQEHFQACYTPRNHSRYFDLWFWNGLPDMLAELPQYARITE